MTNIRLIHNAYNNLYCEMRRFIWDWDTAYALAELESEVYRVCPNIEYVRELYDKLLTCIKYTKIEDDYLRSELKSFRSIIWDSDDTFVKLKRVEEVPL